VLTEICGANFILGHIIPL